MAQKPIKTRKKLVPKRQPLIQRLRNNFLTGLIVVAPIFLTVYLIWLFVGFVDDRVVPLIPAAYRFEIPGFGLLVFLLVTSIVGTMTKGLFGRQLVKFGESIVNRTPVVRSIYTAVKQIIETIFSQSQNSFQNACLVQYPREGIWAIAFVSTPTKGEVLNCIDGHEEVMSVFLPTTPNPTSGFLLFVPRKDVVILEMTVEEAAKLVISAGLVVPPTPEEVKAGRKPLPKPTSKTAA